MIDTVWAALSGDLGIMFQFMMVLTVLSIPASIYLFIDGLRIRADVLRRIKEREENK